MSFETLEEEQKSEELAQTMVNDRLKDRFLTIYVLGSLLPPALNVFNDVLKNVVPSKKKKKA